MAERPLALQNDPYGEKIELMKFDWRDARVLQWIDKFVEFGWRDSTGNITRQKARQTGALLRSIKWRTWADAGGDRQVFTARYNYYAKFVELALGRGNPFKELPPSIPQRKWSAIKMPETSVQFSYISTLAALDTIEPVISEPPLENVLTLPSGSEP